MKILEIIRNHAVETQEELARLLREENIDVTQATVSRDIKELNLIKIPTGDGRYRYAAPDERKPGGASEKFRRIFNECCIALDYSENILVIKALTGTAPAVAEAIDSLNLKEIVGTVAGDNTVFVLVRPKEAMMSIIEQLRDLGR